MDENRTPNFNIPADFAARVNAAAHKQAEPALAQKAAPAAKTAPADPANNDENNTDTDIEREPAEKAEQAAPETTAPDAGKGMKQMRFWQIVGVVAAALALGVMSVISLMIPLRPTESATEKRKLTEFPTFSLETLKSGEYFDLISAWYSDTVPMRDSLLQMNAKVQGLLGTNTVQGGFGEGVKGEEIPDAPVKPQIDLDDVTPITPVTTQPDESEPPTEETPTEPTEPDVPVQPGAIIQKLDSIMVYGNAGYEYYNFVQSTADNYVYGVCRAGARLKGVAKVYDMIIPTSIDITMPDSVREQLNDSVSDQKKAISYMESSMTEDVTVVPIYDALRLHRDEYVYFRTDHHWTGLGAYYAYVEFCKAKGITPLQLEEYDKRSFPGFLGSFYNDSGMDPALGETPDVVDTYMPKVKTDFAVTDQNGNTGHGDVIFDESNAPASYKYGAFIWGDNPYSVIENQDMESGESILLIKESFGNAIAPLLCAHYKYVYIMDYRYYSGTVASLVAEKGIDDVLFCNNVSMTRGASQVQLLVDHVG